MVRAQNLRQIKPVASSVACRSRCGRRAFVVGAQQAEVIQEPVERGRNADATAAEPRRAAGRASRLQHRCTLEAAGPQVVQRLVGALQGVVGDRDLQGMRRGKCQEAGGVGAREVGHRQQLPFFP